MPSYRKFKGEITIDDKVVAETIMCCHCGLHFIKKFDPKKLRFKNPGGHVTSICAYCDGETCGKQLCNTHNPLIHPIEHQIERIERGL